MSTPPKPDPARGWRFVERLSAEKDVERLDQASDEEVERQMREQGVTVSRVPSRDELLAKVGTRMAERRRAEGASVDASSEQEAERLARQSDADFDEALAALPDPSGVPSVRELMAEVPRSPRPAIGQTGSTGTNRSANVVALPMPPSKRARWWTMLVAAALGCFVAVFVWQKVHPGGSDSDVAKGRERVRTLRDEAIAACAQARWTTCEAELEEARALDLPGDTDARVVSARKAIREAARVDGGSP